MTDKELLELAAKAAGVGGGWEMVRGRTATTWYRDKDGRVWDPRKDNDHALRLAVKLGLAIVPNYHVSNDGLGVCVFIELEDSSDFCAPTRRAIVRAAAEVGKDMP